MRRRREHILRQIGIGIEDARFNRRLKQAPQIVRQEYRPRILKGVKIVPIEFLEEAKKKIAYDMANALHQNNFIKWEIDDDSDPILRGNVKVTGMLFVTKPEGVEVK